MRELVYLINISTMDFQMKKQDLVFAENMLKNDTLQSLKLFWENEFGDNSIKKLKNFMLTDTLDENWETED